MRLLFLVILFDLPFLLSILFIIVLDRRCLPAWLTLPVVSNSFNHFCSVGDKPLFFSEHNQAAHYCWISFKRKILIYGCEMGLFCIFIPIFTMFVIKITFCSSSTFASTTLVVINDVWSESKEIFQITRAGYLSIELILFVCFGGIASNARVNL